MTIANTGTLTLLASASVSTNSFLQTGSGPVALAATITSSGSQLSFQGAVNLTDDVQLIASNSSGAIVFGSTVDGGHNLNLQAQIGAIAFSGAVGATTPLATLQITGSGNLSAAALNCSVIDFTGIAGTGTLSGAITTTGALGINLQGANWTVSAPVTTYNNGPCTISQTNTLTIGPDAVVNIDGPWTQIGINTVLLGGDFSTNNESISFQGAMVLTGDASFDSGGGDITLGNDLDGVYSIILTAGSGDVLVPAAFSTESALVDFTVSSARNITMNGTGIGEAIMTGELSLSASGDITLHGVLYGAHSQYYYSSGGTISFDNNGHVHVIATGGNIAFASDLVLESAANLNISSNGGNLTFTSIEGTMFENITVNTGTGNVILGAISSETTINAVNITGNVIVLTAPISVFDLSLTATSSIENESAPVLVATANSAFFNCLEGDVGSIASPIQIQSGNLIFAGANELADFEGSSIDNIIVSLPSNPPCVLIFNGDTISDCNVIPPPVPASNPAVVSVAFAGCDSSYFNLSSDFFFLPGFLSESYLDRPELLFMRSGDKGSSKISALYIPTNRLKVSHRRDFFSELLEKIGRLYLYLMPSKAESASKTD